MGAAGVLTAGVRDQEPSVRLEAVAALSAVGGAAARQALAGVLRQDPDPTVRLEAAYALAPFAGEEDSGGALHAALADPDRSVREAVTWILASRLKRPK